MCIRLQCPRKPGHFTPPLDARRCNQLQRTFMMDAGLASELLLCQLRNRNCDPPLLFVFAHAALCAEEFKERQRRNERPYFARPYRKWKCRTGQDPQETNMIRDYGCLSSWSTDALRRRSRRCPGKVGKAVPSQMVWMGVRARVFWVCRCCVHRVCA